MAHAHSHSHHGHSHAHGQRGTALFVSLILTAAFVVAETAAGLRAGSLALLSDAGHNFTDAFGLLLAAVAFVVQSRPANQVKTYGYHRTGVLAAFINALLLVALSLTLFYESYQRMLHPQPVAESIMVWVAGAGLVLNLGIAWGLTGHGAGDGEDINVRAVWIHMLGDAASCVAIIVGAVVIHYTGWLALDPLLSIVIGAAIIWTAWDIFRDSLNILLEGLPKGLKLADVVGQIRSIEGVMDVHDVHIWSLGSEAHALSCHVLIEDMPPSASDSILRCVNRVLADRFDIHHTTLQFEHLRCALAEEPCTAARHQH
ncbi:MAG TPA: cation diffusion facilitator family transporter [Bryobacteraceae bacterium]|jgi:cobalt-zinc-cadmium efflux system protein